MNKKMKQANAVDLNLAKAHLLTVRNRYKDKRSKGRMLVQQAIDAVRQADQLMPAVPQTFTYKEDLFLAILRKEGKNAIEIARKMKKSAQTILTRQEFLDNLPEDITSEELRVLHDRDQAN